MRRIMIAATAIFACSLPFASAFSAAPLRASSFVPSCLGVRTEACRSTCVSSQSSLLSPVRSERRERTKCELSMRGASETIRPPASIGEMMKDAGTGVLAALNKGVKRMAVEVPLPITGGTELDDWPGGIGQKYETLRPMLQETLKSLGFNAGEIAARSFMSLEDDAIGIWKRTCDDGQLLSVVCFATPEVLGGLQELSSKGTLILVNHQFFLDQFSRQETKDFIASCELVYLLQSLNMKGPGLLPIKGVLKRVYPDPFVVGRRVDAGVFEILNSFRCKPPQQELVDMFFKDSEVRDKSLSFFDRLKQLGAEATNI